MNDPESDQEISESPGDEERQQPGPTERPQSTTVGIGSSIGVGCLIVVVLFIVAAFAIRSIFGSW